MTKPKVALVSKFLLLASVAVLLTSCETPEDQSLASAQTCIDTAKTSDDADRCYAIVDGVETEKAYLVRCSASYIAQGFTGARFAAAFQRLKDNPSSGQDPMATVMAYLIFSKTSTRHSADNTLSNCTKSGVRSMVRLATMSKLATFIATASGGISANIDPLNASFDPAAISAAITNLAGSGSAEAQANVGAIAAQANTAYCNAGSSFENNEICTNLSTAISAGGTPQSIGQALLAQLQRVR
jgi:hypothetical protein